MKWVRESLRSKTQGSREKSKKGARFFIIAKGGNEQKEEIKYHMARAEKYQWRSSLLAISICLQSSIVITYLSRNCDMSTHMLSRRHDAEMLYLRRGQSNFSREFETLKSLYFATSVFSIRAWPSLRHFVVQLAILGIVTKSIISDAIFLYQNLPPVKNDASPRFQNKMENIY